MRALDRKLWGDLRRVRGQAVAISLVLASGVSTFVMSTTTLRSLEQTRQKYYTEYRFADAFVHLERAPNQFASRLAEITGVAQIETRIRESVLLDMPGMTEPATAQLLSLADDSAASLNAIYLRAGRLPDPNRRGEIVIGDAFAEAHGLTPGDRVRAILNGREQWLQVVGLGLSPEFVYAVPPGQFLPDNRRFGVFWMSYRQIETAFDMQGAFNDVALTLQPGAALGEVIFRLDDLTAPYGGTGAYGRQDQTSHRRLSDELLQLRGMAVVTPAIFLSVSAFLFNVVLSRMIQGQREDIATLRAFGYTAGEIGGHYGRFIVVLLVPGVLLGVAMGVYLASGLTTLYGQFFRFPFLVFQPAPDGVATALLLSITAGSAGGYWAVRRAMRLPPSEAMRPEAPATYHATWLDRWGVPRMLTPVGLMIVRRIERNRRLTVLSVLGIALGEAVLVLGTFVEDTVDYVLDVQFHRAQRQDATLTFFEPVASNALFDVLHLPGVRAAEGFRAVPVRLRHGWRSRRLSIMGLEAQPRLFRVLDEGDHPVTFATQGLTISQKLAELLAVEVGDTLTVEVLERDRPQREIAVTAVFPDYTEPGAYMQRQSLHRLLREGDVLSGVFVALRSGEQDAFFRAVKQTPRAAGLSNKWAALVSFRATLAENLLRMRAVNVVFSAIIAFGVVYNAARITLAERSRELATMRVLGFTRHEVSGVLLGELACITLLALPLGLVFGYWLSLLATHALDTETQRFPLRISAATLAYAASVVLIAVTVSAAIVRHLLDELDLIAVLKARE